MPAWLAALPSYVSAISVAVLLVVFTGAYAYERMRRRSLERSRAAAEAARKVLGLELERARKSVLELQRRDSGLKGKLLAGIATRLREPLEEITTRMRALNGSVCKDAADFEAFANLIGRETAALEDLIEGLAELAALESGSVRWRDAEVEVASILGKAVTQADAAALRRDVTIETRVDGSLPPVYGDPDRLARVLANLLDNAIKVSPPGTTVSASAFADGSEVVFSVADAGDGIGEEELDRLLENLERVGATLDETHGSGRLGIGLAICRLIVQRHGGRFWSETSEGCGSEFGFALDTVDTAEGGELEG